jgi:hypothetical protein
MHRKLLEIISMDFDARGQLLIIYSALVQYFKNGNMMKHCINSFIDIKKADDSVRR